MARPMDQATKQEREISLLRDAQAAFNRGNIAAGASALDPEIEWIEPFEFPGSGTYRRAVAVRFPSSSEKLLSQSAIGISFSC